MFKVFRKLLWHTWLRQCLNSYVELKRNGMIMFRFFFKLDMEPQNWRTVNCWLQPLMENLNTQGAGGGFSLPKFLNRFWFLDQNKVWAVENRTDILLDTAKITAPRAKLYFKWSELLVSKIKMRNCTSM